MIKRRHSHRNLMQSCSIVSIVRLCVCWPLAGCINLRKVWRRWNLSAMIYETWISERLLAVSFLLALSKYKVGSKTSSKLCNCGGKTDSQGAWYILISQQCHDDFLFDFLCLILHQEESNVIIPFLLAWSSGNAAPPLWRCWNSFIVAKVHLHWWALVANHHQRGTRFAIHEVFHPDLRRVRQCALDVAAQWESERSGIWSGRRLESYIWPSFFLAFQISVSSNRWKLQSAEWYQVRERGLVRSFCHKIALKQNKNSCH